MIKEATTFLPLLLYVPGTWITGDPFSPAKILADEAFLSMGSFEGPANVDTISLIGNPIADTFFQPTTEIDPINKESATIRNLVREIVGYIAIAKNAEDGEAWDARAAAEKAVAFLEAIPANVPLPKPMLLSEQVALYWSLGDAYAEIDFDGTNCVDAYGKRPGLPDVSLDEFQIADGSGRFFFPTQLERIISGVSEG